MSYPIDLPIELEEYNDDAIFEESVRRRDCKRAHKCHYCGKRLDSCIGETPTKESGCKLNAHTTPVPADIAQEAVLQTLAMEIDRRLPSRRGFVLLVTRFGEPGVDQDDKALASYVSSMDAAEVPKFLEGMAGYIRNRGPKKPSSET